MAAMSVAGRSYFQEFLQPRLDFGDLLGDVVVAGLEGEEQVLSAGDDVVGRVHGSRRAGFIVEAPGVEAGNFDPAGKVDDVVVGGGGDLVGGAVGEGTFGGAEHVGPAAGAVVEVAGDVGEGRVVGGETADPGVERGGDDGERTALAAAGDGEVGAVPAGAAGEEVVGADAAEIDAAIVVAIAVVEAEGVVAGEGAGGEGVVDRLVHRDGDAMDADLEGDDAAGGHVGHAAIGTDSGAGDAEEGGVFAGGFGLAEDAIEAGGGGAGADVLEVDVVAVSGGVAVLGEEGEFGVDGEFGEGGFAGGPELVEVGGVLLRGLDAFGREGGGGEGPVGFAVLFDGGDAAEEAGFGEGAAVDGEALGGEVDGLVDFWREHFGTDAVGDFKAGDGVAVLDGDDAEADGLAGGVAPIGVVSGDAELEGADAVLGEEGEGEEGEKG